MQTLTIEIKDSFVKEFLNFVKNCKNNIKIKDKNLEYDPLFYERQKELYQLRSDIKAGKIESISNEDFWEEIDSYVETLQHENNSK